MMSRTAAISARVLDAVFEAAFDVSHWSQVLSIICKDIGATAGGLIYHDPDDIRGTVTASHGIDSAATREYSQHWGAHDPWAHRLLTSGQLQRGFVVRGRTLVSAKEFEQTAYAQEFAMRYGLEQNVALGLPVAHGRTATLTILRDGKAKPFSQTHERVLRRLYPEVANAFRVHRRLLELDDRARLTADALDRLKMAVLLFDTSGRLTFMNCAAEAVVHAADGLTIAQGRLRCATSAGTSTLHRAIANANSARTSGAVNIERSAPAPPLRAVVCPLPPSQEPTHRSRVALFVTGGAEPSEASRALLQRLYGLTPQQATIATALASGCSVQATAARLGISVDTVRWHVKQLLHRTDTCSQAELVATILASPVGVVG